MKVLHGPALLAGGMAAQWAWNTYFPVFGLAPQVLLVLSVALASRADPPVGQSFAFFWGLFLDALAVRLFGANALALTLTAYGVGMARRQMDISNPLSQGMVALAVSYGYGLFMLLVGLIFQGQVFFGGWKSFWLIPILNGVIAPAAFFMTRRWGDPRPGRTRTA